MPEMNGLEATRIIRERECDRAEHIPIIALTADALQENRDECRAAGMDECVTKPIRSNQLHEAMGRCLARQRKAAASHR